MSRNRNNQVRQIGMLGIGCNISQANFCEHHIMFMVLIRPVPLRKEDGLDSRVPMKHGRSSGSLVIRSRHRLGALRTYDGYNLWALQIPTE
jgi:hypothetical protein